MRSLPALLPSPLGFSNHVAPSPLAPFARGDRHGAQDGQAEQAHLNL
jgi:hypothetical protein